MAKLSSSGLLVIYISLCALLMQYFMYKRLDISPKFPSPGLLSRSGECDFPDAGVCSSTWSSSSFRHQPSGYQDFDAWRWNVKCKRSSTRIQYSYGLGINEQMDHVMVCDQRRSWKPAASEKLRWWPLAEKDWTYSNFIYPSKHNANVVSHQFIVRNHSSQGGSCL